MSNSQFGDDFMVFSGSANLALAEKVANYLGKPLNKIDIKHFPDGETFCQVIEPVRGQDVFVIQSGSPHPNDAYMELFIIMDALRRGSAARITAVLPYYGYARQDRKDQPRVPITARLIANLLQCAVLIVSWRWTFTRTRYRAFSTYRSTTSRLSL